MISSAILLAVVASMIAVMQSAQNSDAFSQDRSQALDNMRFAMQRITRDVRQADTVAATATADRLEMDTFVQGVRQHVVIAAVGSTLTRTIGGSSSIVLQSGLASTSVFGYVPAASGAQVVTITLQVHPARTPQTTLVHTSEVRLRNVGRTA